MLDSLREEVDLLGRHLEVLERVRAHEPIGIVALARATGHAQHEVRYSLRKLQEAHLVEPTPDGATTTEETPTFVRSLDEELSSLGRRLAGMAVDVEVRTPAD